MYLSLKYIRIYIPITWGGISSSVLSVFFTDNCYKLLKSLHLIGWEQICQWKTLTKRLMKRPPPVNMYSLGDPEEICTIFILRNVFARVWMCLLICHLKIIQFPLKYIMPEIFYNFALKNHTTKDSYTGLIRLQTMMSNTRDLHYWLHKAATSMNDNEFVHVMYSLITHTQFLSWISNLKGPMKCKCMLICADL